MNQKAKDYIRRNTLDLESDNRMDSTGYVQYAISEAKALIQRCGYMVI